MNPCSSSHVWRSSSGVWARVVIYLPCLLCCLWKSSPGNALKGCAFLSLHAALLPLHLAQQQAAHLGSTCPCLRQILESVFLHHCYFNGGCRLTGYTPISASGPNGAILHYGHASAPNNRQTQEGDMMLMDMGCEYYRYGSDVSGWVSVCSNDAHGRSLLQG
eukprot:1140045-Pelagomonas_calceolata.AAC.5